MSCIETTTTTGSHSNKKRKEMDETIDGDTLETDGKKSYDELEKELQEAKALIESLQAKLNAKEEEKAEDDDDNDCDEESISDPNDPWMVKYAELREFRMANGHCTVPLKTGPLQKLGFWVGNQKKAKKANKLSQDRLTKLESVGINWGKGIPVPLTWEEGFAELEKFKAAMGHCNMNIDINDPSPLAKWALVQRFEFRRFRKGSGSLLGIERIQQLRDIGFKFKSPSQS